MGGGGGEKRVPGCGSKEELVLLAHKSSCDVGGDGGNGVIEDVGVVSEGDVGVGSVSEPDRYSDGMGPEESGHGELVG